MTTAAGRASRSVSGSSPAATSRMVARHRGVQRRVVREAVVEDAERAQAERELGFLAHQLRRPRGVNVIFELTEVTPSKLADELVDLLGYLRPDRTARRGQRERDVDVAALDLDVVDQPQLDEVEQAQVDHVRERFLDIVYRGHRGQG